MVYYFYIKWEPARENYRYVVAAPDVETVDEWWRQVQPDGKVTRYASDFFTYNAGNWYDFKREFDKVFLWTLLPKWNGLNQPLFPNPIQPRSDPIQGKTFYIRSKSKPTDYWYVTGAGEGRVYSSDQGRTRFHITIDGEHKDKELYMIAKDKIIIAKASDPKFIVGINSGMLYLSQQSNQFTYSDLKDRLLAEGGNSPVVLLTEHGLGEEWELVS